MQNTMLDSSVSSNSQELFNFKAEHNGEACIESLRPEDVRTPNAFRFTIAMLCAIYSVSKQTMHNNIDSLLEDEEIAQSDIFDYAIRTPHPNRQWSSRVVQDDKITCTT